MSHGDFVLNPVPGYEPAPFDIYDDDLMRDIMGNERLAKPVQALLITLDQIKATNGSFGVDPKLALEALLPILKELRKAVKEQWEADQ